MAVIRFSFQTRDITLSPSLSPSRKVILLRKVPVAICIKFRYLGQVQMSCP